jgi:hypothetical protein
MSAVLLPSLYHCLLTVKRRTLTSDAALFFDVKRLTFRYTQVGHLGAVFYRFTMPRLTNAQKQENYGKRKKGAEEGSQRPKKIRKTAAEYQRESHGRFTYTICGSVVAWNTEDFFFLLWLTAPWGPRPPHYRGFTITLRHTTLGRTPLDEWSARHRDLYLTTHNKHNTNIHATGGIRTRNPSKRTAADPRLRPRGHWDRLRH